MLDSNSAPSANPANPQRDAQIAWLALPVLIALGCAFAAIVSNGQPSLPNAAYPILLAFAVQWLAFIPAFRLQNEHFYDLVGGGSFIAVTLLAAALSPTLQPTHWLLIAMVLAWALRLALFLFVRVRRAGKDRRFDQIKASFPRFLMAWTFQGLWITFTLAPILAALALPDPAFSTPFTLIGSALWLLGFAVEVTADLQKARFRRNPANRGQFIQTGLWAKSRHPNYAGEICLWCGVTLIVIPALSGLQFAVVLSPILIFCLLNFVSGIPLLEKYADAKWGHLPAYQQYKSHTPVLWPRLR